MSKLLGKVAIVTGSGSGMGREIAALYAKEGAKVVLADFNAEALASAVEEMKAAGGDVIGVETNVAVREQVDNMVQAAVDTYGTLDILVNNAGIMDNFVPVWELEDDMFNRVLDINLKGAVYGSRAAINVFLGQDKEGAIINVASIAGLFGSRGGAAYTMSKHAVVGMTKNIAATYGGAYGKIRANAIAPGNIVTPLAKNATATPNEVGLKPIMDCGPSPEGAPQDIANLALFLASDDSRFINGEVIKSDGGWTAK